MKLRELHYFVEVVRNNGFGRATDKLYVTQPAISRAIKQLEGELGGELLIRDPKGVRLTERGRILFRHAENMLQQERNLHRELLDIGEEISGTLRVGLPPVISSTYFPQVILYFRNRCPLVELEIIEIPTTELERALQEGKVDIAAGILPLESQNYKTQLFATDSLVLVVPNTHLLANKSSVTLPEFANEPFIQFTESFKINELILCAFGLYGLTPKVVGRSSNFDLVTAMIHSGMGVSLLPGSIWKDNTASVFTTIPVIQPPLLYDLALIRRSGSFVSRSCQAWIDVSAEVIGFTPEPDFGQ
ncbi:hypothetical protein yaldo0001_4680 [Yersinia aldovae ATCC 35236]|uniref:LysR family transcriptional regulator n=1 Tax=Yersinia aldovae TaxID=29483 RepID=A0A0T9UPB4_YERAL|nr:LysR substrate-binding domain-containing protein [Yersinia aldovae]EEP94956.1 hypothetical protein yaldo0001_4680 [Yersinia aldovae ATCC 35236]CNK22888.1 LysR family transcriptional regulator [Yersinia aldovae]CNL54285.1 LysR family transcriptional regulator [Yersinia aldovae]CNL58401.1 LysR family transcriptional regulator [Yersinia aldovae]